MGLPALVVAERVGLAEGDVEGDPLGLPPVVPDPLGLVPCADAELEISSLDRSNNADRQRKRKPRTSLAALF